MSLSVPVNTITMAGSERPPPPLTRERDRPPPHLLPTVPQVLRTRCTVNPGPRMSDVPRGGRSGVLRVRRPASKPARYEYVRRPAGTSGPPCATCALRRVIESIHVDQAVSYVYLRLYLRVCTRLLVIYLRLP